ADMWSVTLTLSPRARVLLLVALVVALMGAGLNAYTRLHKSNGSTATARPSVSPPKRQVATPKPIATPHRPAQPKQKPKPKAKPAGPPAPSDHLPPAIRRALANQNVVVVALYDPKAKID